MSPAAKTTCESVTEEAKDKAEIRDDSAALFLRGVVRIAEVQKQSIDLALQQNP